MKTRTFIVSVSAILALSVAAIALWQTNLDQGNLSIPVIAIGISMILLALTYSMYNGRNRFVDKGINDQFERSEILYRGVEMKRMYPISWRRGSHINMFEFINDNRAGLKRARWKEKRLLVVNEPLQKAHSRACPRCGGSAGHACPCRYRSKY